MNHLSDELLNEYLDGVAPKRAELQVHLDSCVECAARLATLQVLFSELDSLPDLPLRVDLAARVARDLRESRALPRWLRLTVGLQAAAALIIAAITAPFALRLAASAPPLNLQLPSLTTMLVQLQMQWTAWLDALSRVQAPALPQIPTAFEASSLYGLALLAVTAVLWLVGNGLLLRSRNR